MTNLSTLVMTALWTLLAAINFVVLCAAFSREYLRTRNFKRTALKLIRTTRVMGHLILLSLINVGAYYLITANFPQDNRPFFQLMIALHYGILLYGGPKVSLLSWQVWHAPSDFFDAAQTSKTGE